MQKFQYEQEREKKRNFCNFELQISLMIMVITCSAFAVIVVYIIETFDCEHFLIHNPTLRERDLLETQFVRLFILLQNHQLNHLPKNRLYAFSLSRPNSPSPIGTFILSLTLIWRRLNFFSILLNYHKTMKTKQNLK